MGGGKGETSPTSGWRVLKRYSQFLQGLYSLASNRCLITQEFWLLSRLQIIEGDSRGPSPPCGRERTGLEEFGKAPCHDNDKCSIFLLCSFLPGPVLLPMQMPGG